MYVCMYVCMYGIHMYGKYGMNMWYVYVCVFLNSSMIVLHALVCIYGKPYICMYECIYVCVYVCMYVCMHAETYGVHFWLSLQAPLYINGNKKYQNFVRN